MALIFGHSQVKYLHDCLVNDRILSLRYPGYKVRDFMKTQFSTVSSVPASFIVFLYIFCDPLLFNIIFR